MAIHGRPICSGRFLTQEQKWKRVLVHGVSDKQGRKLQEFGHRRQSGFARQTFPRGIGDAELEFPVLCPGFFLFVLTDFQQDAVRPFLQGEVSDVLINH